VGPHGRVLTGNAMIAGYTVIVCADLPLGLLLK